MKRNTLKIAILFFGITLVTSCNIFGQEEGQKREHRKPPSAEELLKEMDANEDGKLSKKEVKGRLKKHFDKIDANEDGFLTKEELEKAPKPEGKRPPKRDNK